MDYSDEELDDLRRLHALREQLRAMAEETVATMRDLPQPKTWAEACSKLRTVAAADRVVTGMFSPRRTRTPVTPSAPKPRPPKPEPSPFMQGMDDIERSLKQIIGVKTALDEVPGDMAVPPALAEALRDLSEPSQGPAPLQDQTIALARFNKELTTARALHRLRASGVEIPP